MEVLETCGVPFIGYQTNELPAFYSISNGLPVDFRLDQASEISKFAKLHWGLGLSSAVLVTVPPPTEDALETGYLEAIIKRAMDTAKNSNIKIGFMRR